MRTSAGEVALGVIGILALAAVLIALVVADCNARNDCKERGGRVVKDRDSCYMSSTTHHSADGRTSWTTYDEICNWRCDAPAERP